MYSDNAYKARMMMLQVQQVQRDYVEKIRSMPPEQRQAAIFQLQQFVAMKRAEIARLAAS